MVFMAMSKNCYSVPIGKKDVGLVVSDPKVHGDFLKHAVDFVVPEGTEVLAACKGKVSGVHIDSDEGGVSDKYRADPWGFVNWITIDHENGEFSQYFHLRHGGSCVEVGQEVEAGEVIGYSGNTGLSTGPHLHFHVAVENDSEVGWETLKIRFEESLRVVRKKSDFSEEERKVFLEMSD